MDLYNSSVETYSFSPPEHQTPSRDSRLLIPAVIFSLCFVVGVPGNIAVIILRPNWKHLSSLSQSLMLNLAMSDLLSLLTLPLWTHTFLYGWTFGLVSCKLLACFLYCSVHCSMLTVTGLSIQRYLVVVHGLKCHEVQKRLVLVLLWVVAFILTSPFLVFRQTVTDQQWTHCQPDYSTQAQWMAILLKENLFGTVLYTIVTFSYIRLKKKINQSVFFNNRQTNRLITSISVSLFILWFPYFIINMLGIASICLKNEELKNIYTDKRRLAEAISLINSCLNPLLYAFTSSKVCSICLIKKPVQETQIRSQTLEDITAELS